jgi:C4-dicarboxylate-specific signal transduction histidine kinase
MEGPMDIEKEKALQTLQMSFIGKTLSTYTHEMKNHLAIIKESSGLIQDMIELGKLPRKKKDAGPFLSTLQAIDDQVVRSTKFINILNRFAHRLDSPASTFDINEIIEELIVLMNRLAKQKRIVMEGDFQQGLPSIHSTPYRVQLILYTLMQEKLEVLNVESKIVFRTAPSNGSVVVTVLEQGSRQDSDHGKRPAAEDLFQYAIRSLNGEIGRQTDDHAVSIRIPLTKH